MKMNISEKEREVRVEEFWNLVYLLYEEMTV